MAVEAERRLRKLARASGSEAFLIKVNSKVASLLAGPGGAKLLELERDTGKFYSLEPHSHLALDEIDVIADGPREEILAGKPTVTEERDGARQDRRAAHVQHHRRARLRRRLSGGHRRGDRLRRSGLASKIDRDHRECRR